MPLRIDLAPGEKLYIGRSVLVNGKTRIDFSMEGFGPFLKERDFLHPASSRTLIEKLYCLVQQIYLGNDASEHAAKYIDLVSQAISADQIKSADAAALNLLVEDGSYYAALKNLKKLLPKRHASAAA